MWAPNPVAFQIAGFSIYWYGIIITLAVLAGILVSMRRSKRYDVSQDDIIDYALFIIPSAIVGARIYYVVFNFDHFSHNLLSVFDVRQGGLAFYGGLIGSMIAVLFVSRHKKIALPTICDIAVPGVALGQAIGRWGNFVNQEAYGEIVTNPSLQFFPYAVFIENRGSWYMAAFFYESLVCFLIFLFLIFYARCAKRRGNLILWYGLFYGLERAVVEGLRLDSLYWGGVRVSQALSIALVVVCGAALIIGFIKRRGAIVEVDPNLVMRRGEAPSADTTDALAGDAEDNEESDADEPETDDPTTYDDPGDIVELEELDGVEDWDAIPEDEEDDEDESDEDGGTEEKADKEAEE